MMIPLTIEGTTSSKRYDITTAIPNAKRIVLVNAKFVTTGFYLGNSVSIELGNTISGDNVVDSSEGIFYLKTMLRTNIIEGKNYSEDQPMIGYESAGQIQKQLTVNIRDPNGVLLAANQLDYFFVQFQVYTE